MKKQMMRLVVSLFLLVGACSTPVLADGTNPVPMCVPGRPCNTQ